jgi:hypothetical protein
LVAAATFILIESPFLQLRERWLAAKNGAKEVSKADLKASLKPEPPELNAKERINPRKPA